MKKTILPFCIIFLFSGNIFADNYSLSFDGSGDYVTGTASSALDVSSTNRLTISAWVRPDVFLSSFSQAIFVHTSSGTSQQYALTINGD